MPLCGFKPDMVKGNSIYLKGLLDATLERDENPRIAIEKETKEIELFINALKKIYGRPEYAGKRKSKFIYGIAILSQAFFEEAVELSESENIHIEEACECVMKDAGEFLKDIEDEHQRLKKIYTPEETMIRAVKWIDENAIDEKK